MTPSGKTVISVTNLGQVCVVVRDLEKTMRAMWETFGIGPWNINIRDAASLTDMTYHGRPARFGFKVARTQKRVGGIEMELVEPIEGDNIYSDFLKEHGEGIQHLGWYRVETLEAFHQTRRDMEQAGFPCVMSGRLPVGAFAYFDTRPALPTVLEVLWSNPAATPLPPMRVFP